MTTKVGRALTQYRVTAAEDAAGVTPTNYSYEDGYYSRYSTVADWLSVGAQGVALYVNTSFTDSIGEHAITSHIRINGPGKGIVTITGPDTSTDWLVIAAGGSLELSGASFTTWRSVVDIGSLTSDIEFIRVSNCRFIDCRYAVNKDRLSTEIEKVKRFRFYRNYYNASGISAGTHTAGVYLRGPYENAEVSKNIFLNVNGSAITLGDNFYAMQELMVRSVVDGNYCVGMDAPTTEEAHGVLVYGIDAVITNNHIANVTTVDDVDGEGIYTKCRYAIIKDNVLLNASDGQGAINIKGQPRGSTTAPQGFRVICSGNYVRFSTVTSRDIGINVANESVLCSNNVFENCYSAIETASITGLDDISIRDNKAYNTTGQAAFTLGHGGNRCTCVGNEVYLMTSSTGPPVNSIGILVNPFAAVTDLHIEGNYVEIGNESVASTDIRGISITRDQTLTHVSIKNNTLRVTHSTLIEYGIRITDTTAGTDWQINGNDLTQVAANPLTITNTAPSNLLVRNNPGGDTETITGAGAITPWRPLTHIVTTGANALTLADGYQDQRITLVMTTDGGDGTLNATNEGNFATITFDSVGDSADMLFTNSKWHYMGGTATVA